MSGPPQQAAHSLPRSNPRNSQSRTGTPGFIRPLPRLILTNTPEKRGPKERRGGKQRFYGLSFTPLTPRRSNCGHTPRSTGLFLLAHFRPAPNVVSFVASPRRPLTPRTQTPVSLLPRHLSVAWHDPRNHRLRLCPAIPIESPSFSPSRRRYLGGSRPSDFNRPAKSASARARQGHTPSSPSN